MDATKFCTLLKVTLSQAAVTILYNFNIHRDDPSIKLASQFFDSLSYNNLVLCFVSPTYSHDDNLDLAFTITTLLHLTSTLYLSAFSPMFQFH